MKTRVLALIVLVLAVAAPAGIAARGMQSTTTLHITAAAAALKYSTSHLTAPHGKVSIVMKNLSPLQHDVAIKGNGVSVKGKLVGKGGLSTVTATLKRGTYTFYCTVPGHAAAGMKGTLKIT